MKALKDWSPEEIIEKIKSAETLTDLCKKLQIKDNGGNKRTLRKFIKNNQIDLSHFKKTITKDYYNNHPKFCKNCGKVIDWKYRANQFCSHSCSASYNNHNNHRSLESRKKISEIIQRKNPNFNGIIKPLKIINVDPKTNQKICKNCGKLLNETQKIYCSFSCQHDYQRKQQLSQWKLGLDNGLSGKYSLKKYIRQYLLDKVGYKCEICGWSKTNPFTNTIPLEIHHKDGNYRNNKEENLQVLCPNCHSLTETFKGHNRNGRKARSKYYKE